MADTCEVQAIDNINSEIFESHIKVVLTTHCIKAQICLINKLKKKAEDNRETCNFISSTNYKLQAEINQAHIDIKSLLIAQDAIRTANIELQKDLLMAKERKNDVIEKVKNGERKFEYLWIESKARYESLHFVQKLLKAKDELQRLQKIMTELENEEKRYIEDIQVKKENCLKLDHKRVIKLADFMVNVKPQTLAIMKKNAVAISELKNDLEKLSLKLKANVETEVSTDQETNVALKVANDTALMIMPKLQLMGGLDFNVVSEQTDEVMVEKADSLNKMPVKNNINYSFQCTINIHNNDITEEYISSYFNKPSPFYEETKPQNYSNKKFIHILDNVNINNIAAQKIMEKVNPETLQPVDSISAGNHKPKETSSGLKFKGKKPLESDEIEEIDLTGSNADILLLPPTQFLDKSLEMQGSQKEQEVSGLMLAPEEKLNLSQGFKEGLNKKKVSFDLPNTLETNVLTEISEAAGKIDAHETLDSQQNIIAASDADDGFDNIKDMIFKKHNLDLSPKFVYAKNITTPSAVQNPGERVVTSKFFQQDQIISKSESEVQKKAITETDQPIEVVEIDNNPNKPKNNIEDNEPTVAIDVEADTGFKPKKRKINEQPDKPESGFLFSQAAEMTFESLDVSMNNTGLEDDAEFPHCIDSSLLLSPKADLPPLTLTGESTVQSQDVPNFLSGIRKTGFSLFGCASTSEPKPDANAQNPGGSGFSFNFGGEEKKRRGGLFSMFQ